MWTCRCGKQCADEEKFCSQCGSKHEVNSDAGEWFYMFEGERKGPVTIHVLIDELKNGNILPDTYVWHIGFTEWKKANQTQLSQYINTTVPPVAKDQLSDKWLWCLATLPITTDMLVSNFLYLDSTIVTILVIVLNCVFLALDTHYLRKAGYNAKKWLYLGLLLVPVYLLVRAIKTNKNFIPLVFWCVLYCVAYLPIFFL